MNIKTTLSALTLGLALLPLSASATLLVGFHSFDATNGDDVTPDDQAANFSGYIQKVSDTSTSSGGDTGGNYGLSGIASGVNDGTARINGTGSVLFSVTNNSSESFSLTSLLFDATVSDGTPSNGLSIAYRLGTSGAFTLLPALISPIEATSTAFGDVAQDFSDFAIALILPDLAASSTIQFQFATTSSKGGRLDNIALTGLSAIPETASAMALALLIGGGLMTRNRRSAAAPTLA